MNIIETMQARKKDVEARLAAAREQFEAYSRVKDEYDELTKESTTIDFAIKALKNPLPASGIAAPRKARSPNKPKTTPSENDIAKVQEAITKEAVTYGQLAKACGLGDATRAALDALIARRGVVSTGEKRGKTYQYVGQNAGASAADG